MKDTNEAIQDMAIDVRGIAVELLRIGLTLDGLPNRLDFYAAHAPAVPDWFKPQFEDPPLAPAEPRDLSADGVRAITNIKCLEGWHLTPRMVPDERQAISDFHGAYAAHRQAVSEWGQRFRAHREVQWRWYWAARMLEARP